jgi:hypothetical protein
MAMPKICDAAGHVGRAYHGTAVGGGERVLQATGGGGEILPVEALVAQREHGEEEQRRLYAEGDAVAPAEPEGGVADDGSACDCAREECEDDSPQVCRDREVAARECQPRLRCDAGDV